MATNLRRFTDHNHPRQGRATPIPAGSPADLEARTRYRKTVRPPSADKRVLKSGHNSIKIGKTVIKGRLKGFPIYTLTLEERATCARTCHHWLSCYGNEMHWSHRFEHGAELEERLDYELRALAREHPKGYLVRLHVLGDFYSGAYVKRWQAWLDQIPQLHVFGYTSWRPSTEIGALLSKMSEQGWDRWSVRQSVPVGPHKASRMPLAVSVETTSTKITDVIICPEQQGKTDCCATCGLCWATKRPIGFARH